MENLLSVIVPLYNSEQYIGRCARSLFDQTQEGMEYIFVDDGSTDNSVSVLQSVIEEFPDLDVSIAHHTENKGLVEARRTGILAAKGKYLIFADSDDWVEKDMYGLMLEKAVEENADLVVCDFYYSFPEGKEIMEKGLNSKDLISDILSGRAHASLCNKLFRASLFDSLKVFPNHFMWEDAVFSVQLVSMCRKIEYIDVPLYHYFQYKNISDTSVSIELINQKTRKLWEDAFSNANLVIQFLEDSGQRKKYCKEIDHFRLRVMLYYYPLIKVSRCYRKEFSSVCPYLAIRTLFNRNILLKTRLGFLARRCYASMWGLIF